MMPWGGGPNWGGWRGGNWGPMHGGGMPVMMMAMIDTDGSGTISYAEVEAFHRRMFDYLDSNKDGELSPDEIQAMMGGRFGGRR
ncbi:EF-hand domain-containing protein [Rhizobiales bacterium L72]|uniref:EF-hand domain-containing protein n=2 Tax=Propylenella binzhouense TaxID=2555902 RepID=A0A964WVY9_9HYPH|nr:EF-hand domain-containing protein [Propylenella binzhouense]